MFVLRKIGRCLVLAALIPTFTLQLSCANADTAARYSLSFTHVPRAVQTARLVDRFQKSQPVSLVITLQPRNRDGLKKLLGRLYNPADPLYDQFLTHQDYVDRFAPTTLDVAAVRAFAERNGFEVKHVSGSNMSLAVTGTEANVENAFGVTINDYVAANGRKFYAPSAEPTVSPDVANKVSSIIGLENYETLVKNSHQAVPGPPPSLPGIFPLTSTDTIEQASGISSILLPKTQALESASSSSASALTNYANNVQGQSFSLYSATQYGLEPSDIHLAYDIPSATSPYSNYSSPLNGATQTVALAELGSFLDSDIQAYMTQFWGGSFPYVAPEVVPVIASLVPLPNYECTLDIDMIKAVAPAATLMVYEAPDGNYGNYDWQQCIYQVYDQIATDNEASVVSSSWGYAANTVTPSSLIGSENDVFIQMMSQGQSFICASGDTGAYANEGTTGYPSYIPYGGTLCVQDPASQQYATAVGATSLNTNSEGEYGSEVAWWDTGDTTKGTDGTGGGGGVDAPSSSYAGTVIPSYQVGAFNTSVNPQGSTTYRNVPDVSLFGDFDEGGYYTIVNGAPQKQGGSSAAAPLWAGLTALVNQGRQIGGMPRVGFLNPTLYSMAENSYTYGEDFHDVTSGNNLYYNAVPGYDNATGWGSFIGYYMIQDLVTGSTWKPVSLSVDASGYDHVLWSGADGYVSIWTLYTPTDSFDHVDTWGFYPGWTPKQILSSPTYANSPTYVLWASSPGTAAIWQSSGNTFVLMNVNNSGSGNFGPGGSWTAQGFSENTDGSLNVLWDNTANGSIEIWKGAVSGTNISFTQNSALTGPAGYTAQGITTGPNSQTYVMWTNTIGAMTTWATNGITYSQLTTWGPFSTWKAISFASAPDSTLRIMWTDAYSDMILWATNGTSSPSESSQFGPFISYSPTGLAVDSSDNMRVLWDGPGNFETVWTTAGTSVTQTPNEGPP